MAVEVTMPKLGLTMTEGTVEHWYKKEGDLVDEGETIVEIQAECSGVLLKIVAEEGTEVPVKGVLAYIGEAGETVESGEGAAAPKSDAESAPAGSVLVIGGGPGGYVAAIRAAQLGAKTTLIEKSALGGTCLNVGCMPTKALLHSAQVYELATKSESCGIIGESVLVDWKKVQANRAAVTEKLTNGVKALVKVNKIKLVDGQAVFTGPKSVRVGDSEYTADKVIIASGSHPIIPDIPGVSSSKACIDSTGALTLDHVPESMVIIGGGVIGLELGSVYNSFGTEVTVIEAMPKLLPLMDAELTAIVRAQLEGKGIKILTDSRVLSVSDGGKGALVEVETPEGNKTYEAEKVLLCVGRAPNTDGLGLDQAGIEKKDSCINTNEYLETSVPDVYAVGDCTGKMMLAHAAMMMGEAAAENAMGGSVRFDPDTVPACAFVGPEFAGVGLTEEAASSKGIKVKVGRFPMSANGRSLVMGYTDGMIKVVADAEYGEILGVHILAANAADIIEEAALAMKLECTLDELTETVHCHPTVSEALREASLAADKKAVHTVNR